MKSMNWISGTGRRPYKAIPIAVPMIPPSARGVSKTRSGNSSRRPSVHLKTPPFRPTSSPRTITRSSRRISSRNALLIACTIVIAACSRPRGVVFLVRISGRGPAREPPEHVRIVLERPQVRVLVEPVPEVRLEFHGPREVLDHLGLVAHPGGDARQVEVRARARRLQADRVLERFERPVEIARVKQVVPEAVPALRVVGVRVAQQAIDPRCLGI